MGCRACKILLQAEILVVWAMLRINCPTCKSEVEPQPGRGRPRKYCSPSCQPRTRGPYRYKSRHAIPVGTEFSSACRECGVTFLQMKKARGRPVIHCSADCLSAVERKASAARYQAMMLPHRCVGCGSEFLAAPRSDAQQYCSVKCSNEPRRLYVDIDERRKAERHRRRARIKGSEVARFSAVDVYERDGWTCGICREPVDRRLKHPDHMAASLDHIVPLSRGGAHTVENCQCSHWICNSRKTDRLIVCEAA